MKKSPSIVAASKPVSYSPLAAPDRIVALTAREVGLLVGALGHEWASLQMRLAEFSAGDEAASSRAARRRVEEIDMLTAKLGGRRP